VFFTREGYIKKHPDTLQRFLEAALKGWGYCFSHPDSAVDIVLKFNQELNRDVR
jgi:NitT/TauT family transport system substrate-binding protein